MEDVIDGADAAPLWRDFMGVVHECRSEDFHDVFLTILTLCDRRVPPNAHYVTSEQTGVTCASCVSSMGNANRRAA